jgi:DNA polymerase-1
MSRPLVWLIDAHYQIFRAYYSMPDLQAPDGTPVGALRGYVAVLIKFLARQQPTHVIAAFDHDLTSFRNEIYPEYKEGRVEPPEDLAPQFDLCFAATEALGMPCVSLEDYEADDVIATLVRRLLPRGADVMIVTADKDLGALVSDRVRLYDLAREQESGPKEIEARLGVAPEQVEDFLTLVGDSVDNIPGVRGIGAKTAARLLAAFGSVDLIPRDAESLAAIGLRGAAGIARKLSEGAEQIALSRRLVRMREDLPVDVGLDEARWDGADRPRLEALLGELGAGSLLERVPRFAP